MLKHILCSGLLLLCIVLDGTFAQPCQTIVRRDARSLSTTEWNRFIRALQSIKQQNLESFAAQPTDFIAFASLSTMIDQLNSTSPWFAGRLSDQLTTVVDTVRTDNLMNTTNNVLLTNFLATQRPASGIFAPFDVLANIHRIYRQRIHNTPLFLPWHRQIVNALESALREVDPGLSVPYWDWSRDASAPQRAMVWRWMGTSAGTGDGENAPCIPNGPFVGWQGLDEIGAAVCIRRGFDGRTGYAEVGSVTPFPCMQQIVETSATFEEFQRRLTVVHDQFHFWIGYLEYFE